VFHHDRGTTAEEHPLCDQMRLPSDYSPSSNARYGRFLPAALRIVPGDCIVRWPRSLPCHPERRSNWKVPTRRWTRRDSGQYGSGQKPFRETPVRSGDRGQGTGGRHAERRHCFTHDVFAQDRTECGSAVATAGEREVETEPLSWMS